jgi:hypothetical protein
MRILLFMAGLFISVLAAAQLPTTVSAPNTEVYFISPKAGAVMSGEFTVRFGLRGMGIAPAGTVAENTGHHHLIIDAPLPDLKLPVPLDDKHKHFGKGQTETVLKLSPGKHTLQLLLADSNHIPHRPAVYSKIITITVK